MIALALIERTLKVFLAGWARMRANQWRSVALRATIFVVVIVWSLASSGPCKSDDGAPMGDRRIECGAAVTIGRFSPDDKIIALGTEAGTIELWDVVDGTRIRSWKAHEGPIESLAFHPNGKTVVSEGRERVVRVWENDTGEKKSEIIAPSQGIRNYPLFINTHMTLTASGDRIAAYGYFWETTTGKQLERYGNEGPVSIVGDRIACLRGMKYEVLSLPALEHVASGSDVAAQRLELSPDGSCVAIGRALFGGGVAIKDLSSDNKAKELPVVRRYIFGLCFTPDSEYLAVGSSDEEVVVFSVEERKPMLRLATPGAQNYWVGFTADGKRLAAVGTNKEVRMWSFPEGVAIVYDCTESGKLSRGESRSGANTPSHEKE